MYKYHTDDSWSLVVEIGVYYTKSSIMKRVKILAFMSKQ